jgi:hypothetical protein
LVDEDWCGQEEWVVIVWTCLRKTLPIHTAAFFIMTFEPVVLEKKKKSNFKDYTGSVRRSFTVRTNGLDLTVTWNIIYVLSLLPPALYITSGRVHTRLVTQTLEGVAPTAKFPPTSPHGLQPTILKQTLRRLYSFTMDWLISAQVLVEHPNYWRMNSWLLCYWTSVSSLRLEPEISQIWCSSVYHRTATFWDMKQSQAESSDYLHMYYCRWDTKWVYFRQRGTLTAAARSSQ